MDTLRAKELWEKAWNAETHTSEYAAKRIKSAKSAKLTPIKIDATDLYGYFQGSHGRYETFLDSCPCGDFRRSKLPCKHIYRLAIELGVLEEKADSNANAIPTPYKERVRLTETIDLVEGLSEDAQKMLLQIAGSVKACRFDYDSDRQVIDELLESGLIVGEPKEGRIYWGLKKELLELLDSEGIPYPPKAKRTELEQICAESIPQKAKEKFGVEKWIIPEVSTSYSERNIHYYLHRKLNHSDYMPDDAITYQLVQRGYYSMEYKIWLK